MELTKYSESKEAILLKEVLSGILYGTFYMVEKWNGLRTLTITTTCSKNVAGIVIGKGAKTIKALQRIFLEIGLNNNRKVSLCIDPVGEKTGPVMGHKTWEKEAAIDLFERLIIETGHKVVSFDNQECGIGIGLKVYPQLPKDLFDAFHTVMEAYGKSHNQNFGLLCESDIL